MEENESENNRSFNELNDDDPQPNDSDEADEYYDEEDQSHISAHREEVFNQVRLINKPSKSNNSNPVSLSNEEEKK
jgi:hypothetical protein